MIRCREAGIRDYVKGEGEGGLMTVMTPYKRRQTSVKINEESSSYKFAPKKGKSEGNLGNEGWWDVFFLPYRPPDSQFGWQSAGPK